MLVKLKCVPNCLFWLHQYLYESYARDFAMYEIFSGYLYVNCCLPIVRKMKFHFTFHFTSLVLLFYCWKHQTTEGRRDISNICVRNITYPLLSNNPLKGLLLNVLWWYSELDDFNNSQYDRFPSEIYKCNYHPIW